MPKGHSSGFTEHASYDLTVAGRGTGDERDAMTKHAVTVVSFRTVSDVLLSLIRNQVD